MKREILKSVIIASVIIIFGLSATYAYKELTSTNNIIAGEGGCFEVNYSGEVVSGTTLKSTTNYLEGSHSIINLSKESSCQIYTEALIYLRTNSGSTVPLSSNSALKYKVLSGETIVSEGTITTNTNEENEQIDTDTLLASVELTTTETSYDVYIWIDSNLSNGAYNNKTYSGYLYATSTQTSDILE